MSVFLCYGGVNGGEKERKLSFFISVGESLWLCRFYFSVGHNY